MKLSALILALLFCSFSAYAQDYIYYKDGSRIAVTNIETNVVLTSFRPVDKPNVITTVFTDNLGMIQYANGESLILVDDVDRAEFERNMMKAQMERNKANPAPQKPTQSTTNSYSAPATTSSTSSPNYTESAFNDRVMRNPHRNSIGFNAATAPFDRKYLYAEYEHMIRNGISVGLRAGYYDYSYRYYGSDYTEGEWETGGGVGISSRLYPHGKSNLKGFFVGSAVDVIFLEWGWSETSYYYDYDGYRRTDFDSGYGTSVAVAITGQMGYKIALGKTFFVEPSLITGFYGSSYGEGGFILMPGLTAGFRFK